MTIKPVRSIIRGATAFALALTIGACDSEAPPAGSEPSAEPKPIGEATPVSGPQMRILAFGDSLFAGYNVGEGESYPAVLESALRQQGIDARVTNAGVSGDTTQAGRERLAFTLDNLEQPPDLAIVELGGNDLLRAIPPAQIRENLAAILAELDRRGIPVLLMGMRAPPNLGADFVGQFDALYPALAEQYDAELVPFFLEAVYDHPQLIQPDRVHPTAEGIEALVAATVDEVVEALPEDPES